MIKRLSWPAAIIYLDGLINPAILDADIMKPLLEPQLKDTSGQELLNVLNNGGLISRAQLDKVNHFEALVPKVLIGEVALFLDGFPQAFIISCKGYKTRSIPEPTYENAVRGPREAFVETLSVNIGLIRKRLITPNLVVENIKLGKISSTNVAIAYIKGLASEGLVAEVRKRLTRIEIDAVLESHYLEQLIQDSPYSPFPQLRVTERPDAVAGALLEGRVAILTDNTPSVLTAPGELAAQLAAAEDYYSNFYFATLIRWLRLLTFLIALTLPSFYIAITNFHQEMIPTTLFISIAAARQGVPFPGVVEAVAMEVMFEVLREATIRLPANFAQVVSIVGALVIGQAAVQANLVSPLMIIVVAITGIASFTIPQYSLGLTIRLLRFPLMLSAALLGLFGVMTVLLALLLHLCSLRSFGVPYLTPLTPFNREAIKDSLLYKSPLWSLTRHPSELVQRNTRRIGKKQRPGPPDQQR
ncbi:MAG: spore germination protein [Bacillota bacterium]|nr:spore germination protein [Bacillota bacterium]